MISNGRTNLDSRNQMQKKNPEETFWGNKSFTPDEFEVIQATLDKQLGPEFLSTPGKLAYIEAWKVISIANKVFGFNGWSSSVEDITVDCEAGKYSVGASATTKVILKDGSYHMDTGYGSAENIRMKAQAFEKARKEAVTDALKRTLKNFGNVLAPEFSTASNEAQLINTIQNNVSNSPPKSSLPSGQSSQSQLTNTTQNNNISNSVPSQPSQSSLPSGQSSHPSQSTFSKDNILKQVSNQSNHQNTCLNNNTTTENNGTCAFIQVSKKENVNNVNTVNTVCSSHENNQKNQKSNTNNAAIENSSVPQSNTSSFSNIKDKSREYTKEEIANMFEEWDRQNNHYLSAELEFGSDFENNFEYLSPKENDQSYDQSEPDYDDYFLPQIESQDTIASILSNEGPPQWQLKNSKNSNSTNVTSNQKVQQVNREVYQRNSNLSQCIGIKSPTNSYLNNSNGHQPLTKKFRS
ncbi:923_t:CDS:10 [Diversispora eburnea]|uniref:923_t:CDS:1 n=1 Tax=Diversispora eburnea TaxID=1213867 RepID=A0A9N8WER1_9GLOM|nr:923_t:CDS:10 [Diversispora eburnea]